MDNKFKKNENTISVTQSNSTKSVEEYKKKFNEPNKSVSPKKPMLGSNKEKGVHQPVGKPGMSQSGMNVRTNNTRDAKTHHKEKLEEIKNMPKPNLTRSEAPNENEIGTKFKQEKMLKKAKISEPGFSDESCDCPYCQEYDNQTQQAYSSMEEPCPYCNEEVSQEDDHSDCPYCQESDQQSCDPSAEDHPEDCPYCNEEVSQEEIPSETRDNFEDSADDSQDFDSQDLMSPDLPKPGPEKDTLLTGQNPPPTDETNENIMLEQNPTQMDPSEGEEVYQEDLVGGPHSGDDQSPESLKAIAQQLEDEETVSPDEENMTAEDIATGGNNMQDNVSRPEGYDEDENGDMGLSEDENESPDLTEVFSEGLDSHADNIQREKVVQIVGDALGQFKGCKDVLERAKEQAPQLYGASISMLRAMIEMASMLGLGQQEEAQMQQYQAEIEGQQTDGTAEDGHPDYNNLFPANDEQNRQEDHQMQTQGSNTPDYNNLFPSKSPAQGDQQSVGQSIGKLPTSATTQHVAKNPIPEGGVNEKGQKKVTDNQGIVRFINMKEGRVAGPSGVPVKPPQR